MRRTRSDPAIFSTRRSLIGRHYNNAIPGYTGFVPGRDEGSTIAGTFARSIEKCQLERSIRTWDGQAHRLGREDKERTARNTIAAPVAPMYDKRGIGYPAAGDTFHSRVPPSKEEKAHHHSLTMGLTSLTYENLGGAGHLQGYSNATKGVPGYTGYVPGKNAENVFADGWSKCHDRSVSTHFHARSKAPKKLTLLTEGRTAISAVPHDGLAEVPIKNPSYQDHARGWSDCFLTGKHVDGAGRAAPHGRQEAFGCVQPPVNQMALGQRVPIHGYAGWVPGRVGESVVGERQCKTNAISDHLFKKQSMRITQR